MMEGVMGSTTRSPTLFPPVRTTGKLTLVQVVPLLVERKSPELVPTYNVVESFGSTARELTVLFERPALMVFQVSPLFVDTEMLLLTLAYRVEEVLEPTTSWTLAALSIRRLNAFQVAPLSMLLRMTRLVNLFT
jgi:hypothetical protein